MKKIRNKLVFDVDISCLNNLAVELFVIFTQLDVLTSLIKQE